MVQRSARSRKTLLERESELTAVDEALGELTGLRTDGAEPRTGPRGALLAVVGRAGIGKTTLLAEVRRRAAARGCTVLAARGGEQEQRVAFHVARQLLQPQFAGAAEVDLRAQLGSWYDIVGPALGLCAPTDGAPPDPQGLRDGLDWVLTHLAVLRAPMVLVLDDAHWADPESLSWLAAFAPRAEQLPILVVVAYRPDELPDHAESFRALPGRAGGRPLDLEPFSALAVARLMREALGAHADDAFCRECWAVTAGNPFETVELAAKVRDRGFAPTEGAAHLLRDLAAAVKGSGLIARMERLGTSTVRFAWACAVLGTEIHPLLAAAVAGLGHEEAADAADALRGARVLTGVESLEFVHPLIATAVYRAIPAGFRVALHGQAAWCVVNDGRGSAAAARHLLETHPDSDPWVVQQLRAAAAETLRSGAPDAARSYLARALREPPASEDRAAVLYELGSASCSPNRPPRSTTCVPPSTNPSPHPNCATASCTGSHRSSPTATVSPKQSTPSPGRSGSPRTPASSCAWSPSSSCGTPSAPTNPTTPRAPAASPNSPTASPAATSPSGTSSACAPGTPSCAANPRTSPCTTQSAPSPGAWAGPSPTAGSRCPSWSPSRSCTPTAPAVPRNSSPPGSPTSNGRAGEAPTSPSPTPSSRTSASAAAASPRPRTSSARGCVWPSV